jgi:antitoxin MazE
MSTKLQKWGNSLAVRIPDEVVEDAALRPGTEVTVRKVRNTVVITPTRAKKRPTLEELVAKITPENQHEYQWEGIKPVGKEVW